MAGLGRTLRALLVVLLAQAVSIGSASNATPTVTTTATNSSTTATTTSTSTTATTSTSTVSTTTNSSTTATTTTSTNSSTTSTITLTTTTLYTTVDPHATSTTTFQYVTITSTTTTTTTTATTSTISTSTLTTSTTTTSTVSTTTSKTSTTMTSSTSTTTSTSTTSKTSTTTTKNPGAAFKVNIEIMVAGSEDALARYLCPECVVEGGASEASIPPHVQKIGAGPVTVADLAGFEAGQAVHLPQAVADIYPGGSLVVASMTDEDKAFFNKEELLHAQRVMKVNCWYKNTSCTTEARRLVTKPVSVSIARGNDTNFADVRNLPEPILITLMETRTEGAMCTYYDEESLEWSTEGITTIPNGTALVCATTHLSIFAVLERFMEGMLMNFKCSTPEFFTPAGFLNIINASDRWWRLPGSFLILFVIVMQLMVVKKALDIDKARERSFWSDECFLVSRPGFRGYKKKWYEPFLETMDLARTTMMNPRGAMAVALCSSIVQFRVAHELRLIGSEMKFLLDWANKHLKDENTKVMTPAGDPPALEDAGWYEWYERATEEESPSTLGVADPDQWRLEGTGDLDGTGTQDVAFFRPHTTQRRHLRSLALENTLIMTDHFNISAASEELKKEQMIKVSLQQGVPSPLARRGFLAGIEDADTNRSMRDIEYQNSSALALVLVIKKRMSEEVDKFQDATLKDLVKVMFVGNQPWMQVRSFSVMKPAADLALILTSKIAGAMAAASYTVGMTAHAFGSDSECDVSDDLVMAIGKTVGVSLLSITMGSVPAAIFTTLNNPGFVYKARWSNEARLAKLAGFKRNRKCLWIMVPIYIAFCLMYTLSFIANVNFGDASRWFRTSTTTLLKMSVIIPLILAFIYAITAVLFARQMLDEATQEDVRNKLMIGSAFGAPMTEVERSKLNNDRSTEAWVATQQDMDRQAQAATGAGRETNSSRFWSFFHNLGAQSSSAHVRNTHLVSEAVPAGSATSIAKAVAKDAARTTFAMAVSQEASDSMSRGQGQASIPGQVDVESDGWGLHMPDLGLRDLESNIHRAANVALGRS